MVSQLDVSSQSRFDITAIFIIYRYRGLSLPNVSPSVQPLKSSGLGSRDPWHEGSRTLGMRVA